jgi:hypothetical protein
MHLGQTAVAAGKECMCLHFLFILLAHHEQFAGMIPVTILKHHFNVSDSYVMHKLQLVIPLAT